MSSKVEVRNQSGVSREPMLDLVRLFACFIVLLHHATISLTFGEELEASSPFWLNVRWYFLWLTKFGHGTPIFFVLAGWLVMNTLEKSKGDRRAIAKAFGRRMRRILPPYWLALGFTALLFLTMENLGFHGYFAGGFAAEFQSPRVLTTWQWIGNLSLTETWRALYTRDEPLVYTRVAWALCYHEQFIALAIAIAVIVGTQWRKFLMVVSVLLLGFQIFLYDTGATHRFDGLFFDRWYCFAAGLMAFEIVNRKTGDWLKWSLLAVICGGIVTGWAVNDVEVSISSWAAVILVAGSHFIKEKCPEQLGRVIAKLSPWTYFIYLVHFPFETITNRFLYEYGVQSFWARALFMVPVSMTVGIIAGIAFGMFVKKLDTTTVQPIVWLSGVKTIIGQWHQWPQRIWQAVAVEPILLRDWHLLPRQARAAAFDRFEPKAAGLLSDLTPCPSATR